MRKLIHRPHQFIDAGENFMTPHVLSYWRVGDYTVELSTGEGFNHAPIWGVTVKTESGESVHKLCQCHHSIGAAMAHIAGLDQ